MKAADPCELAVKLRMLEGEGFGRIGSISMLSAMHRIRSYGSRGVSVSLLAQSELVTVPTMSRMLSSLEKLGFIAKLKRADDGRGVSVRLTDSGVGAWKSALRVYKQKMERF